MTIDEKLEAYRGGCSFIQYIPNKPAKYGIKIYALVDSKTFYTYNPEIYCGKQPAGPFQVSNSPSDVVLRLVDGLERSNRNSTCDNWYSSCELRKFLLEKSITFIGILKKNKREVPVEFLPNKSRAIGTCLFGFQEDLTLVSYIPKQNTAIFLISTMHDNDSVDVETGKPEIILDYNRIKGGVDTVDQKCNAFSVFRRTKRWPFATFMAFLNVAEINAYILYTYGKLNIDMGHQRQSFPKHLLVALMKPHMQERLLIKSLPLHTWYIFENVLGKPPTRREADTSLSHRGGYYLCGRSKNNYTTVKCSNCSQFSCKNHSRSFVKCDSCINSDRVSESD
nr:piggyBac transposable element-derived protein 4-like [Leptinotarsa decemlineata]